MLKSLTETKIIHHNFRVLNIKDNKLKEFRTNEILSSIQYTIEKFDMSGDGNAVVDVKHFNK